LFFFIIFVKNFFVATATEESGFGVIDQGVGSAFLARVVGHFPTIVQHVIH